MTYDRATSVTVLFADISGSTFLYAIRGDEEAFRLSSACLEILQNEVTGQGGRIVKRLGDAVLAVFDRGEDALCASVAMQRRVNDPAFHFPEEGLRVRVGMSAGTAVVEDGDVYGDVVNVAARLVSLAGADEILFSSRVYESLPEPMRTSSRLIDQLVIRGRPTGVVVYEHLWRKDDVTVSVGVRSRPITTTLELAYEDRLFVVGPERPKLTVGRGPDNDLVIDREVVSRCHAEIELCGDKFVLRDLSTNGTYVCIPDGPTLRASRDQVTLVGIGEIRAGEETAPAISFRLCSS